MIRMYKEHRRLRVDLLYGHDCEQQEIGTRLTLTDVSHNPTVVWTQ